MVHFDISPLSAVKTHLSSRFICKLLQSKYLTVMNKEVDGTENDVTWVL